MRRLHSIAAPAAFATLALVLTACGTTSAPTDETPETAGEPITVIDGLGEEVTLENGPATRVVALEWAQAEILTSLGANVVGVADVEGYDSWAGTAVPLEGDPADVGARTEPSVESIADLEPDLIVGVTRSIPDAVREQVESIAPILLLDNANAADPLGEVENSVTTLARAVGEEDAGTELLAEFDATLEAGAEKIAEAGLDGTPVVFASPYADGSNVTIRMHGPGSAPQAALTEIGLMPAWDDAGDEAFGLSYTDVEGLTALPDDAWFLYWDNSDSDDPVETYLADNAVWQSLAFVTEDRVAPAGNGIWVYGGPVSLGAFADEVVEILGAS